MNNVIHSTSAKVAGIATIVSGVLFGTMTLAGATPVAPTPEEAVTDIGGSISDAVLPAMVAAVTAVVGLIALSLAVKYLWRFVKKAAA